MSEQKMFNVFTLHLGHVSRDWHTKFQPSHRERTFLVFNFYEENTSVISAVLRSNKLGRRNYGRCRSWKQGAGGFRKPLGAPDGFSDKRRPETGSPRECQVIDISQTSYAPDNQHIPPWERENHPLKSAEREKFYVSSLEGKLNYSKV